MPLSILLTGVNAFIGRHVVRRLCSSNQRVCAIARAPPTTALPETVRVFQGNLRDPETFAQLNDTDLECIIHIAATSARPGVSSADMCRDNVVSTMNLIDWACERGVRRFIYTSSVSIYGVIAVPEIDGTTPVINPDIYGMTKYLGETLLRDVQAQTASISIRLPGVVGTGADRIWLSRVIRQLGRDEDVTIVNPDAPFNNVIHVEDLADFIAYLAGMDFAGASSFPVGAAGKLTILGVVETLREALNSRSTIKIAEEQLPSFTISNHEAMQHGYKPRDISAVLNRYANDFLQHDNF